MEESAHSATLYRNVTQYVREEPLTALAIATATGFCLGGGINRRIGFAILAIIGRIACNDIASSLIVGTFSSDHGNRRSRARAGHDSGRHDNGRADLQKPG